MHGNGRCRRRAGMAVVAGTDGGCAIEIVGAHALSRPGRPGSVSLVLLTMFNIKYLYQFCSAFQFDNIIVGAGKSLTKHIGTFSSTPRCRS